MAVAGGWAARRVLLVRAGWLRPDGRKCILTNLAEVEIVAPINIHSKFMYVLDYYYLSLMKSLILQACFVLSVFQLPDHLQSNSSLS
jgi:hypothetical protein